MMLWSEKIPFPAVSEMAAVRGMKHICVHTAEEGAQFLLGAAVIQHEGVLHVSWLNSWRQENDNRSVLAEKCSADGGRTWTDRAVIAGVDADGYCRSHGVYLSHEGRLLTYCPRAKFDRVDAYPELKCEVWEMRDDAWKNLGIAVDADFWPMCEPIRVGDHWLMAGLETDRAQAAVAISDGDNLHRWTMAELPNPKGFKCWGETTVIPFGNRLTAIVRDNSTELALISESLDGGYSWSDLRHTNLPMASSKVYGGVLTNGERYLVFNAAERKYRQTLAIAVGKDALERVYIIRDGGLPALRFRNAPSEWSYPYAHEADGKLYVAYSMNKEDCELAILPVSSLME